MNNIGTVVVTYNRKMLLKECLNALLSQKEIETDIILIDNCSTDGTQEYIADLLKNEKTKLFKTESNIGGAGGFNYGIKKAVELGYEMIWLMDDDSIPDEFALKKLIDAHYALKGDYGFLCSRVLWTDGTACKMNIPDIANDWANNICFIKDGIIPVDKATFVGFLVKTETVMKIGLPITEFFLWSDDTNYSIRLLETGHCYCAIESIITHKMTNNNGASIITDNGDRVSRYFYAYRNRYYNFRYIKKMPSYWLDIFKTTLLIIARSKNKIKKLYYMYKGVFAGIKFKPEVEYIKK